MLTPEAPRLAAFTRREASRLGIAAIALIVVLATILGLDFIPQRLKVDVGTVASADIVAPRALEYVSTVDTNAQKDAARNRVELVYDFTTAKASATAERQLRAFEVRVRPIDQAFAAGAADGFAWFHFMRRLSSARVYGIFRRSAL